MNPDFIELLQIIEQSAPYFPWEFHTNGTKITPELAADITSAVWSGKVFVSIDGGNDATHDRNRGSGSFQKAVAGARSLLAARRDQARPEIGVFQLDLGLPESDYAREFLDVASRVDEWVRVRPVRPTDAKRITIHRKGKAPALSAPSVSNKPSERWWTLDADEEAEVPAGPCFWAGNAVFIAPDGDVSICLVSHTSDGVLGNLFSDPLDDILRKGGEFRRRISTRTRAGVPHCSSCKMSPGEPRQHLFMRGALTESLDPQGAFS